MAFCLSEARHGRKPYSWINFSNSRILISKLRAFIQYKPSDQYSWKLLTCACFLSVNKHSGVRLSFTSMFKYTKAQVTTYVSARAIIAVFSTNLLENWKIRNCKEYSSYKDSFEERVHLWLDLILIFNFRNQYPCIVHYQALAAMNLYALSLSNPASWKLIEIRYFLMPTRKQTSWHGLLREMSFFFHNCRHRWMWVIWSISVKTHERKTCHIF